MHMASANIVVEGRTDSIQSGSLTSRPLWAHQVTAAILFHLQSQEFTTYIDNLEANNMTVSHLMSNVQTWKVVIHNPFTGAKL